MKFEKIYIELSDICGLKCDFCPSVKGIRGAMSVEDFSKIAQKVAGKGRIYALHLLGDPLVLPNLAEFITVAKAHKMPLELTTSGFYMNAKNQALLLQSENIRQINLSLMAFLAQSRVDLMSYFAPILRFLRAHIALKKSNFVNLRLWNLGADFKGADKNESIYSLLEREFGVKIQKNARKNRLASRIALHQSEQFRWASLASKTLHIKGSCYALKGQIGILSNGKVVPCCMDSSGVMALGDILKQDLNEILASPRALAMKEGFKKGEFVELLCQKCEFGRRKTGQIQ